MAEWTPEMDREYKRLVSQMSNEDRAKLDDSIFGDDLQQKLRNRVSETVGARQAETRDNPAYEYGGQKGKAAADATYFRNQAEAAHNRPGVQVDFTGALGNRTNALEARQKQLGMAALMEARARGQVPSIAEMVGARDAGRLAREQSSIAASARGPAALALAQQQNAFGVAAGQSAISNQAQINAAQERLAAEQAALQGFTGIRQQDYGGQTIDAQMAQTQASFDDSQRARNDQYAQGMYGNEIGVNTTQLQAQGNKQAHALGQQAQAIQQKAAAEARADANRNAMIGMGVGMGAGILEAGIKSDERAKVPTTWGALQQASSTWGTGGQDADVAGAEISRQRDIARQALLDQEARETSQRPAPMAVEGMSPGVQDSGIMGALKRRDEQDSGLARAKERHGIELSDKEGRGAASAERRMSIENKAAAQEEAKREKKLTMGERLGGGFGKGLANAASIFKSLSSQQSAMAMPSAPVTYQTQQITSGMESKVPAPMPGPMPLGALGHHGMDALAGARAQSDAMLGMGPSVGGFASDPKAKREAFLDGYNYAGQRAADPQAATLPSYMPNEAPREQGARELRIKQNRPETAPGKETSTPIEPLANANRAMAAQPYTYKPGIAEQNGQSPHEVNVGPMANRMAADPVAATAVKEDPESGLLTLDRDKMLKVVAGGVAAAQRQLDEQKQQMSIMAQRLRGKR